MARVIDTSNMDMVYRDFKRTGRQDFGNVGDLNEFEDADGDTPAQRVMSTWRKWEESGMRDQWIADNLEMCEAENFDAEIAYEYWAAGWRGMAIDALERRRMTEMDNTVRYYVATLEDRDEVVARSKAKGKKEHGLRGWGDIEDMWGEIVESFDTPEEAVDAVRKMGGPTKAVIMKGDLHGPHEYYTPPLERPKMNPAQRALVSNPAWVTKAIAGSYGDLEKKIPPGWLPLLKDPQAVKGNKITGSLKEYGCGAYGCVLPTLTKEVVLKITTDKTEAEFAAHLAATMSVDVTCHYHKVASLPAKKGGDRIYLLWREEAEKVDQIAKETYGKKAVDAIRAQHRAAQVVYDLVFYQKGTVADLAKAITAWKSATSAMGKVSQLAFLSRGMLDVFAHQRIFFGDIHEGNVGLCRREGRLEWVITDPGHVTVIDEDVANRSATPNGRGASRTTEDAKREILMLVEDPDPASLKIAEDLAMDHGVKLAEIGHEVATSSTRAHAYAAGVTDAGFDIVSWGEFDLAKTTYVIWFVRKNLRRKSIVAPQGSPEYSVEWHYSLYDHTVMTVSREPSKKAAQIKAVRYAWGIVGMLRKRLASGEVFAARDIAEIRKRVESFYDAPRLVGLI